MTHTRNDLISKEEQNSSLLEENKVHGDLVISKTASKSPERLRKDVDGLSEDSDYEDDDEVTKKRKDVKKDITDKSSKPQVKRGKRRYCNTEECLKTGSPGKKEEKAKNKEPLCIENSSNSSSDDDEEKSKAKMTPTKKYNGLEEKRKSLRTTGFYSGFSEVAEKRIKLVNNSDERLQNSRAKDRKDVWSSIQGQWPKKTLKELFSDSDTEAATSPPHPAPEEGPTESSLQTVAEEESCSPSAELETLIPPSSADTKPAEEKPVEVVDKKAEFPSSGSNSVLNTPPTTPESPSSVTATEASRQQSSVTVSEPLAPNQEEVRSIKSETDSTIEVDSVAGELQDLQSEGNSSPAGFDASVSSSSSNQPEPEHLEKGEK